VGRAWPRVTHTPLGTEPDAEMQPTSLEPLSVIPFGAGLGLLAWAVGTDPGTAALVGVAALTGAALARWRPAPAPTSTPAATPAPATPAGETAPHPAEPPTEDQLLRATELESLGMLAGGIAHDFNNLLTGILGNTTMALADLPAGAPRDAILEAEVAARRAKELVAQILAWSGRGRLELRPIELGELVTETRALLGKVLSPRAKLEVDIEPGALVEADPAQLRQVVMNLLTNASDALGGSPGRIRVTVLARVRLRREDLDRTPMGQALQPGTYALLEVKDDGCGMSKETIARMFEPFFTTKVTGRGLGLAALLGIVRNHRGAIEVESQPGEGTAMRVWLPRTTSSSLVTPEPPPERPTREEIAGAVLLVEDEDLVRRVTTRMMSKLGFEVVPCPGGREALAAIDDPGEQWTLALVDVQMPEVGGREVLARIRERRPDLPVVLMTGYAGPEAERIEPLPDAWLRKPFSMAELLDAGRVARRNREIAGWTAK
jgi:two-component system cell cycle sensor histidine kinase/response regulator CckA